MTDVPASPRWRILVTPRWLGWHLFAVVAVAGMGWLGDWQFRRALAGNTLSWAYTFEWPIFAIFGIVFWVKTIKDELRPADGVKAGEVALPPGAGAVGGPDADPGMTGQPPEVRSTGSASQRTPVVGPGDSVAEGLEDRELAEYNAYLAKLGREVKGHGRWHGLR